MGKFYTTRERIFKVMYDKQNRNFLLGKIHFDDTMTMDGAKYSNMKVDTTSSPYTMVWYQPTSEHVTVSLSWPKLELDTTDLEFNVEITPQRKLEGKMGWECPSNQDKKVIYFDIKGNNPYIGDYMIQRNGEYEKISETEYKLTWTGKAEYAKGPLAMYSPIDTNIMV